MRDGWIQAQAVESIPFGEFSLRLGWLYGLAGDKFSKSDFKDGYQNCKLPPRPDATVTIFGLFSVEKMLA